MGGYIFLSVNDVMEIHKRVIAEFGGDSGLRDRGLLESAVAMPHATFLGKYLHPKIPAMAGAYHFHLCTNHPFIDGNKRVAVVTAEIFLLVNNHRLDASDVELESISMGVAGKQFSKERVIEFYEKKVKRI